MKLRCLFVLGVVVVTSGCSTAPPEEFQVVPQPSRVSLESFASEVEESTSILASATSPTEASFLLPKATDEIRIHSLPIGAGSCHFIECPGVTPQSILYDCGSIGRGSRSIGASDVTAYLAPLLAYDPDPIVILSHADQDHYNLVPEALGAVGGDPGATAERIWFSGERGDYVKDSFDRWLDDQESRSVLLKGGLAVLPGGWSNTTQAIPDLRCGDAETFVMTVNNGFPTNERSMIVRIEYKDFSATLAGDAFGTTEAAALNFPRTKTTVLTGSHHGASTHTSNHPAWADGTAPEVTIFSAGSKHNHPKCSSMLAYKNSLGVSQAHKIRCGKNSGVYTHDFFVEKAEYVTEVSGVVVVTSNGSDPVEVHCSAEADCF